MLQNNTFLDANFEQIFYVWASENESKIEQFAYFYRKHKICKNHCFPSREITIFLVLSLEKSTKIGCSNAMKNNVNKKNFKNRPAVRQRSGNVKMRKKRTPVQDRTNCQTRQKPDTCLKTVKKLSRYPQKTSKNRSAGSRESKSRLQRSKTVKKPSGGLKGVQNR